MTELKVIAEKIDGIFWELAPHIYAEECPPNMSVDDFRKSNREYIFSELEQGKAEKWIDILEQIMYEFSDIVPAKILLQDVEIIIAELMKYCDFESR